MYALIQIGANIYAIYLVCVIGILWVRTTAEIKGFCHFQMSQNYREIMTLPPLETFMSTDLNSQMRTTALRAIA